MLRLAILSTAALFALATSATASASDKGARVIRPERGTCIQGTHEPLRVRRMPGVAATSDKPPSALEDAFVHCSEASVNKPNNNGRDRERPR